MVELRPLHCVKLGINVSSPASSYVVPPARRQGARMGLLQGNKATVTGDEAQEVAGIGKDTTTHHSARWQGSEGRAGPSPPSTASASEQC